MTASTPSYVQNPFAGGADADAGSGKQMALATALRNYAPNPFAGSQPQQGALAPHLTQAPPFSPEVMSAYQYLNSAGYGPNVERTWRFSPNAPMFKPGYQQPATIDYLVRTKNEGTLPDPQAQAQQERLRHEAIYGEGY